MKRPLFTIAEAKSVALLLPSIVVCAILVYKLIGGGKSLPAAEVVQSELAESADSLSADTQIINLHPFDPNTATYEEFRELGLSASAAASVVKYRERGKRFEIPEDFATCYGVTDSMYAALKPYIIIGEEFRLQPFEKSLPTIPSAPVQRERQTPAERAAAYLAAHPTIDINTLTDSDFVAMGCTVRQAEAVVRWRTDRGGFRSVAEVEECRYLPLEVYDVIAPALHFAEVTEAATGPQLVELNSADSATLVAVRGIGARSASDIIAYRERLGGYARVEQLAELAVVTEKNYEQIITQIFVDSCKISKIDINFAGPESMGSHPYMTPKRVRKILKNRQLKGGWSTIEDMIEDNTLTVEEAQRLSPYLHFSPRE